MDEIVEALHRYDQRCAAAGLTQERARAELAAAVKDLSYYPDTNTLATDLALERLGLK